MDPSLINHIYKNTKKEKIPWINNKLPACLLDLLERKILNPCKIADLGCGIGTYSLCFAKLGFEAYGFDYSQIAIDKATELFQLKGLHDHFEVMDLSLARKPIDHLFEFAFDYEVLHHVFPEDRKQYVKNVHSMLAPNAKYLSVCFSETDECFGSVEKYRKTPLGTCLYFSSEEEIEELMTPYFDILELKTIEIDGKPKAHQAVYCLMQKKSSNV